MWVAGLQPTPPGRALGSSAPRSPELSPDPKKAGPPGRGQGAQRWEEGGRGKQMRIWVENMQEEGIDAWPGRQMVGVAGAPLHLSARANTHTHTRAPHKLVHHCQGSCSRLQGRMKTARRRDPAAFGSQVVPGKNNFQEQEGLISAMCCT